MTGTSWALGRENNLHQERVISAPNAPDTAILRRGVRLLAGILALLILAFCFFASSICITVILAAFLSILVDPAVRALEKLRIPRFVGSRLDVGPVAATIGFLFWGWLWGVAGLLLAVPLTAFIKLLADANPSLAHLSTLLARDPQRFLFGKRQHRSPETTVSSNPL